MHTNPDGIAQGIGPLLMVVQCTDIMKTQGLKQTLNKYKFDAVFGELEGMKKNLVQRENLLF